MGVAIDCKAIADGIKTAAAEKAGKFEKLHGRKPKLRILTVGDNEASKVYVRNKIRDCGLCGINAEHIEIDDYPAAGGACAGSRSAGRHRPHDPCDAHVERGHGCGMEVCTLKMSVLAEVLEELGFDVEELSYDMIGARASWDGGEIVVTATPDEVTVERPTNYRYGTKTYRGKSVRFVKSILERMMANDGFGDY